MGVSLGQPLLHPRHRPHLHHQSSQTPGSRPGRSRLGGACHSSPESGSPVVQEGTKGEQIVRFMSQKIATPTKACVVLIVVHYVQRASTKGKGASLQPLYHFQVIQQLCQELAYVRDEQCKECTDGQFATKCSLITKRAFVEHGRKDGHTRTSQHCVEHLCSCKQQHLSLIRSFSSLKFFVVCPCDCI